MKMLIRREFQGNKENNDKYLLQEPQDGIVLQVRNILLQISLLLSLVSHPVQDLVGE